MPVSDVPSVVVSSSVEEGSVVGSMVTSAPVVVVDTMGSETMPVVPVSSVTVTTAVVRETTGRVTWPVPSPSVAVGSTGRVTTSSPLW